MGGYDRSPDYGGGGGWRSTLGAAALILAVGLLLKAFPAGAAPMPLCGKRGLQTCVIDGDTVRLAGETIRLAGIDAAELHAAKCRAERVLAEAARAALATLLDDRAAIRVIRHGLDRNGRTLADILVDGRDAGAALMSGSLAVKWEGKRGLWC